MNLPGNSVITVAARASGLSKVQVEEVYQELKKHHPHIEFLPTWVTTTGDRDLTTSLKALDKTDFFTKEIDILVQEKKARIGIHSAKDLPDPLPKGLARVALTHGIDARDVLVLPPGKTLATLPHDAKIATSSVRREETIKTLLPAAQIVDIRGTIEQRLQQLTSGKVEGLVVAEAALIRLGLLHLNRIFLPGETAPYQGKLAVIALEKDEEMRSLFACIDRASPARSPYGHS